MCKISQIKELAIIIKFLYNMEITGLSDLYHDRAFLL